MTQPDRQREPLRTKTAMAQHLEAGPRMTIVQGLEAIPVSVDELVAIEAQAAALALAAPAPDLLAAVEAAWKELLLDACASDGPIRDNDVREAIQRNRPKIEALLRAPSREAE